MATTVNKFGPFFSCLSATLLLMTLASAFGSAHWVLDLFSHFRLFYFILGFFCILATIGLCRSHYLAYIFSSVVMLLNLPYLAPHASFGGKNNSKITQAEKNNKFISINLNKNNQQLPELESYLKSENPDFLVLLELTPALASNMRWLEEIFPHARAVLQEDNFGIGIFSKHPLDNPELAREEITGTPLLLVEADVDGKKLFSERSIPFLLSMQRESVLAIST